MPHIITTGTAGASPGDGFQGTFHWRAQESTDTTQIDLPANVQGMDVPPSFVQYRKRLYISGQFSRNLVFNEFFQLHTNGIDPPPVAPVISASGTGLTADIVAYYVFAHEAPDGTLIHQSNPGAASNTLSASDDGVSYTNIPTLASDARVTHVYAYESRDGALPRFVFSRSLGTATATHSVPTAALGEALPSQAGGTQVDLIARGVMPYAPFCVAYHDRLWYAGKDEKIWYSEIGEPESVAATNYIVTRDGETVSGMGVEGDSLIVFYKSHGGGRYAIQGYEDGTESAFADLTITKLEDGSGGCISHWSIKNINGILWWASEDGVRRGAFQNQFLMKDLRTFWRETYAANQRAFERGQGGIDRRFNTYNFLPPGASTFMWVGHFDPLDEGGKVYWTFDPMDRNNTTIGSLADPGAGRSIFVLGSCDGYARQQDDTDTDDDGDTANKTVEIRHKHFYLNGPSGGLGHGTRYTDLDVYLKSENQAASIYPYAGDEECGDAVYPQPGASNNGIISLAAQAVTGFVAKTAHWFRSLTGVNGRGFTLKIVIPNAKGVQYKGFGITFTGGVQSQKKTT